MKNLLSTTFLWETLSASVSSFFPFVSDRLPCGPLGWTLEICGLSSSWKRKDLGSFGRDLVRFFSFLHRIWIWEWRGFVNLLNGNFYDRSIPTHFWFSVHRFLHLCTIDNQFLAVSFWYLTGRNLVEPACKLEDAFYSKESLRKILF